MIKNVKLFTNYNKIEDSVKTALEINGFKLVKDKEFDLGVSIGNDDSFFNMIRECNFDSNPYYMGINNQVSDSLQVVSLENIDKVLYDIKSRNYQINEIDIQETTIFNDYGHYNCYSLRELVIKGEKSQKVDFDLIINNQFLEKFTGDGILVSTTLGSVYSNMGYGGAIIYPDLSTLQITKLGASITKYRRPIPNSIVISADTEIILKCKKNVNLLVTIDGTDYTCINVDSINTHINEKKIKQLSFNDNFTKNISL